MRLKTSQLVKTVGFYVDFRSRFFLFSDDNRNQSLDENTARDKGDVFEVRHFGEELRRKKRNFLCGEPLIGSCGMDERRIAASALALTDIDSSDNRARQDTSESSRRWF